MFWQQVNPVLIVGMRALNRYAGAFRQFGGAARVVNMTMGDEDFLEPQAFFLKQRLDLVQVATRIYGGGEPGDVAPYHRAVLLEARDGNDGGVQCHGSTGIIAP